MVVAAVGLLLLSRVTVDGTYVADLLPGLLVMSAGLGLTFVPLTLIATTNVGRRGRRPRVGRLQLLAADRRRARASRSSRRSPRRRPRARWRAPARPPDAAEQAIALVEGFQAAFAVGAA